MKASYSVWLLYSVCSVCLLGILYFLNEETSPENTYIAPTDNPRKFISLEALTRKDRFNILFWNEYFGYSYFGMGLYNEGFIENKCQFTNCYTSNIRSKWKSRNMSAIVFHGLRDSMDVRDIGMLKKARSEGKINSLFVLFILESPAGRKDFSDPVFKDFFDVVYSYRTDSEVYYPYGRVVSIPFGKNISIPRENKTKGIAWIVSHCQTESKREEYVKELQKHLKKLTIDIYGGCGDHSVPKGSSNDKNVKDVEWDRLNMYRNILKDYKFYLSFENSKCKDYITEKFFYPLSVPNVIPIAFGTNKSDYHYVAPKKSFIHVDDYASPKELATYLEELNENDEEFFAYQTWRKLFSVDVPYLSSPCEFCRILNQRSLKTKPPIQDINKHWFTNQCHN